jgi:integrase
MAVRKRTWTTAKGEEQEAWIADYRDKDGSRCIKTFNTERSAKDYEAQVRLDLKAGVHINPSKSETVAEAAADWLNSAHGLERSTLDQYRQHIKFHIVPFVGGLKLSDVNAQVVRRFEDKLRKEGRSAAMVVKIIKSLGSILADAQEHGTVARNAVRELKRNRRKGKDRQKAKRKKLAAGRDFPTLQEANAIMQNAKGHWRPLLVVAIFTGLRASELRGLRWKDVNLKAGELHVRQRADRYNAIGEPKSEAGNRVVPFGPVVANTLREWKLAAGKSELVFGNGVGKVESLANIINRGLIPACIAAGTVTNTGRAKYTGMHTLRHFFASWCINRKKDGGRELPPKQVQELMGHSSINVTLDSYGHLFPRLNDSTEIAAAEQALFMAT